MPLSLSSAKELIQKAQAAGLSEPDIHGMLDEQGGVESEVTAQPPPYRQFGKTVQPSEGEAFQGGQFVRDVAGKALRFGVPVGAALIAGGLPVEVAAAVEAAGAGGGALAAQQVEQPGQPPNIHEVGVAALMQLIGHLGASAVGTRLLRAGGVPEETAAEVARRGPIGGARMAFGAPPPEAEAMTVSGQFPRLTKAPFTAGRTEAEAALATGAQTDVPTAPLTQRLRTAVIKPTGRFTIQGGKQEPVPAAAGDERLSAQAKLSGLADRIDKEAAPNGTLPLDRFEELFRDEFVEPLLPGQSKLEPRVMEPVYRKALERVQTATRQDIAQALGPAEGARYLEGVAAAKREFVAYEGFRKSLTYRDTGGTLHVSPNAPAKLKALFTPGGADLRNKIAAFERETGEHLLGPLHELSMKRQLTAPDMLVLDMLDEAARVSYGSRFIRMGLVRRGARAIGKPITIGAPAIGAALTTSRKEDSRLRIQGATQ